MKSILTKYTPWADVRAFKLLAECASLVKLHIKVRVEDRPYLGRNKRLVLRSGFQELVKNRKMKNLILNVFPKDILAWNYLINALHTEEEFLGEQTPFPRRIAGRAYVFGEDVIKPSLCQSV